MRRLALLLSVAVSAAAMAAATAFAGPPPYPSPGEPGCIGRDTANFAQDWKSFPSEGKGVAGLVKTFGGTNPTEWLQGDRLVDCTP